MRIGQPILEQMLAEARRGYPFEVCGVLLRRQTVDRDAAGTVCIESIVPVENREIEQPRVRYVIDPEELLQVQRESRARGLEIAGYYHSHPDHPARPSETDRRIAAEGLSDGVLHMVVGVTGGHTTTPSAWIFRDAHQDFEAEALEIK